MSTEKIPIYKVAYDMAKITMEITGRFPRAYRYTLGQELKTASVNLLQAVYHANALQHKAPGIALVIEKAHIFDVMLRLSHDINVLPKRHYARLIDLSVNLRRQAYGWRAKTSPTPRLTPEQHGLSL